MQRHCYQSNVSINLNSEVKSMGTPTKTTVNVVNSFFVGLFIFGGYVHAQPFAGGTGEAGDPYRIEAAEQLMAIGNDPNLLDKHFMLLADIDLDPNLPNGRVFDRALIAPDILDANGLDAPGVPFTGSFDGGDHVISNLVISAPNRDAVGLFGRIGIRDVGKWGTPGVVQNVRLEGAIVDGYESAGALVGFNEGTILNCSANGSITGEHDIIGGLVGYNTGTITVCHTEGQVRGSDYVGGVVGFNPTGVITQCSSASTVRGSEEIAGLVGSSSGHIAACSATGVVNAGRWAGGLVALNTGTVVQSHSTSEVNGGEMTGGLMASNSGPIYDCHAYGYVEGAEWTGGLIGSNSGTVRGCTASGNVFGSEFTGGLVGSNSGTVTDSHATGTVDSAHRGDDIGGLVGSNGGTIADSHATGSTNGGETVGGLVGTNGGSIAQCYARGDVTSHETSGGLVGYNTASITACYAVGRVQVTGDEGVGGLVGGTGAPIGAGSGPSTDSSFWDVDTTGFATRSNGGTGLPTADLQMAQTYLDAGWDFVNTWMICEGVDYPRLQWEQHSCQDEQ